MTDPARRLLGNLQHRVAARSGSPAVSPPMQVEVRLPGDRYAGAGQVRDALHDQLSSLLRDLGIDRTFRIDSGRTSAGAATVAIDGRPVALVPDGPGSVLDEVQARVLRRLTVLAGTAGTGSTADHLTALGCRVPAGADVDGFDVDTAEQLLDDRPDEHIGLEVDAATMRRVGPGGGHALLAMRETDARKWGVAYPDVRVSLTDRPPGTVRLRLNDVTLPTRRLGEDATWTDVVRHVRTALESRRHWFVRMHTVTDAMDGDLVYFFPDLVAVADANYSRAQMTACMRELVRSGRRMRNIPRILWLLLEAGGSPAGSDILRMSESPLLPKARHRPAADRDPIVQAIRVRKLGAEEDWRLGNYRPPQHAVRLDGAVEQSLVAAPAEERARAEWAAVRAVAATPGVRHVVTRTVEALAPVRDALQAVPDVPRVISSHELPPDADLDALPISVDPRRSP